MTNKEKYKQAFLALHPSGDISSLHIILQRALIPAPEGAVHILCLINRHPHKPCAQMLLRRLLF